MKISSLTISGPFVLAGNACGSTALAPGDCQLKVEFKPVAVGSAMGLLSLVDDAGTQTVVLTGTGEAPATDTLSPASLSFPGTAMGQMSAAQTVTLANSGDLPLTSITATAAGPFQVSSNCTALLAGKSSCSLNVTFLPTQAGVQNGSLSVHDSASSGQTVSLTGTGLLPPVIGVNPNSLSFSGQQVGAASSPATLTVTNTGGAPMSQVGFAITGPSAGSFATGETTCGPTLAAGAKCTVQVMFTPTASGGSVATLTVSTSSGGVSPVQVVLSGTAVAGAGLSVQPAQLTFAAQELNQSSTAQTVTISNTGGVAAAGLSVTVSGAFGLVENNCGGSLAAGASCTAGVVFTPVLRGAAVGLVTVSSSTITVPATVAMSGIGGLTGAVQVTPAQVNFPTTGVGVVSSTVAVTITNSSAGVTLGNLALAASPDFKLVANTCGTQLAAGAACTAGVEFAPSKAGAESGSLTLTSIDLDGAATVPLSGTGFDFSAQTAGSPSQTVASGQTASYSLSLAPVGGSSGTFSLSCGTLPSYAACVFSPSSETVASGATGTVSLSVTTTQASASLAPGWRSGWRGLPVAFVLVFAPWLWRRRRILLTLVWLLAVAIGLGGCSASGGGGGGTAPPPVTHTTPAGTYTIQVNVTADGVCHAVAVTLVVD